ncbi:hypothetical protein [Alloactinosynnema sp. L-07]|uniref:hypothetical protein n=1 Tax=Alloactinosynnema sp. L-07 TaxID=1653480 RepID=UPI00065EF73E|nr:hypothetical protein [Alloactinosynnema sp. L-07]CRK57365.1 hypothetical protein [Alloactinosynnema sp. L-07]
MRKTLLALAGLALAAMSALLVAPATATAAPVSTQALVTSHFSGTVAPGGTQHWGWNNAPQGLSYVVGLSPKGASTTLPCLFEVTRTWYVQNFGGEREFHYTIKNIGSIACGTDIYLYSLPDAAGVWSTGGVNPGQTVTKHWNNANPLNAAYVVGLSPTGATSTVACQFEVTREWYQQQPGGEREFWFNVKNVGSIACTAEILLGVKTTSTIISTGTLGPAAEQSKTWNNANPLSAAYIVGFSPSGASASTPCQFELTRGYYAQVINSNGATEREFRQTVKNVGAITCSASKLLAVA